RPLRRVWNCALAWSWHSHTDTRWVSWSFCVLPRVRSTQIAHTGCLVGTWRALYRVGGEIHGMHTSVKVELCRVGVEVLRGCRGTANDTCRRRQVPAPRRTNHPTRPPPPPAPAAAGPHRPLPNPPPRSPAWWP